MSTRNCEDHFHVADCDRFVAQIKALKAAHTIEATPERIGKRRGSAEEPVTARIRRRMEALLAPDLGQDAPIGE